MKKVIKTLSVALLLQCSFSANVIADELKVKIGGLFDFRGAFVSPDKTKYKTSGVKTSVTKHNDSFGFYSNGNVFIDVSNAISDTTSYGAKMSVLATTRNNRNAPTFLYFTSPVGKIELGSNKSAFKGLGIGGYTNACNSDFSDWIELDPNKVDVKYSDTNFSFLDSKARTTGETEYSRKITYYTPEISGFQAGISYIPDLSNIGYGLPKDEVFYTPVTYFYREIDALGNRTGPTKKVSYSFSVKNAIAGGVSFKHEFDSDISIKISGVVEKGDVVVKQDDNNVNDIKEKDKKIEDLKMHPDDQKKYQGAKFTNLMNYMIGGEVKFKDFSLAASYTNAGDSFTSKELPDKDNNTKSDCFIVGARYNFKDLGTSVHYYTSDTKKNKFNAITFALDYKLAQGLTPYAEFTRYNTEGYNPVKLDEKDTQKGSVFILGARLAF